jgi:hypothetical protein
VETLILSLSIESGLNFFIFFSSFSCFSSELFFIFFILKDAGPVNEQVHKKSVTFITFTFIFFPYLYNQKLKFASFLPLDLFSSYYKKFLSQSNWRLCLVD